ncbi:hypothetical protein ACWEKR_24665 [Nocardia sp. NPDC004573]
MKVQVLSHRTPPASPEVLPVMILFLVCKSDPGTVKMPPPRNLLNSTSTSSSVPDH